ncbi:glycosyltransferase [Providencia stuartii]|uniref:glycosyltransferase n=1 Tax=Providencia stuartii TaxID=588 RepID=UPI00300D0F24
MKKPTISVVLLSYNSEKTVIETLSSILNQSYGCQHIELIIGDDASKDDTTKIITSWLNGNRHFFHSVKLNISNINNGLVSNFNSSCKLATSDWIKAIAADDILMKDCLYEFSKFTEHNPNVSCVFCKIEKFNDDTILGVMPRDSYYFKLSADEQFENLLVDNFLPAPGSFIKTSLLESTNYAAAGMFIEDYPMWLKFTSMGIKIPLLDKVLVRYRIGNSVSKSESSLINPNLAHDTYTVKKIFLAKLNKPCYKKALYYFDLHIYNINNWMKIKIFKNKKNLLSKNIGFLFRFSSPLWVMKKIKSRLYSKN